MLLVQWRVREVYNTEPYTVCGAAVRRWRGGAVLKCSLAGVSPLVQQWSSSVYGSVDSDVAPTRIFDTSL